MRILFVSDNYLPSPDGITSSVVSLATGLRELGHQVRIIAPRLEQTSPQEDPSVHRVRSVDAFTYHVSFASPRTIRRVVQRFDPEVLHVHTAAVLGVAATAFSRRSGIPAVLTWHTDLLAYRAAYPALYGAIPVLFAALEAGTRPAWASLQAGLALLGAAVGRDVTDRHERMLAAFVEHFDEIIAPSVKAARGIPGVDVDRQVHVIPSAPLPVRQATKLDPGAVRALRSAQSRMPTGRQVIAFVGRPSPEKNLETLLMAMHGQVLPACPDAKLAIIGTHPSENRYRELAARLGMTRVVRFVGAVPNAVIPHLLHDCSVLAAPSLTETQGLALSEAALVGIPSVTMDPDLDGIVCHGETGLVAPSRTAFGTALVQLLVDEQWRRGLGTAAKLRAERYPARLFAQRVADRYRAVGRASA